MNTPLTPPGQTGFSAGRRTAARVRLSLPGKVILVTGHDHCQLDDLSQTGACITVGGPAPQIGNSVVMMVQGVEGFGSVVWRRNSCFGMMFDEPIAKKDVVLLRAIHDHFQSLEIEQNRRRAREFVQGRRFF